MKKTFRIGKHQFTIRTTHNWNRHWKFSRFIIFLGCEFGSMVSKRNFEFTILNFNFHFEYEAVS